MDPSKPVRVPLPEQDILEHLEVLELTESDQVQRCDELITQHHYLHDASLVGEHLRYAATYRGQWLALASWSAAARHLKARDAFIGWTHVVNDNYFSPVGNNNCRSTPMSSAAAGAAPCSPTTPACWCCPKPSTPTSSAASCA